jgi:hypothetical protein
MTSLSEIRTSVAEQPWELWIRQVLQILRMDLRKNFLSWRGAAIYFLAFAPAVIVAIHSWAVFRGFTHDAVQEDTTVLAVIFQFFYLHVGIFFGSLGVFTQLIRGEMILKSLHFYFLVPVKREVLLAGKFLAGVITATVLFSAGMFTCFALMYWPAASAGKFFIFQGPGLAQLLTYVGITVLACIGYGAVFLATSLILKNPAIAALVVFTWETLSSILPAWVQRLTVIYYLKQLCPVEIHDQGVMALFTVVAEPVSTFAAILGPLVLAAAILFLASKLVRRLEISYATD